MVPSHSLVGALDSEKLAFVMHGVLGSGHNLRSLARRLRVARPEYCFVLIDLRYHGKSLGAPPPHELDSCVNDLLDLSGSLGRAPDVVIGHSLGGKVALAYAQRHEETNISKPAPRLNQHGVLKQIWTLDSDPGAQVPGGAHQVRTVIDALTASPGPFESRNLAVAAIESQGLSTGLANWLATSLEKREDGLHWRFEMPQIQSLLDDYFSLDLWPYLESRAATAGGLAADIRYELLLAENSDRWSGSMKDRATSLAGRPRLQVHSLADAGHWVHVDNPDGLVEILTHHLF